MRRLQFQRSLGKDQSLLTGVLPKSTSPVTGRASVLASPDSLSISKAIWARGDARPPGTAVGQHALTSAPTILKYGLKVLELKT